jgi:uncharacterized protein (DUF885 family)
MRRCCVPLLMLTILTACARSAASTGSSARVRPMPAELAAKLVDGLADEYFAAYVQAFPIAALFNGIPDAPNDRLEDNSLAAVHAWQGREDAWLARLKWLPTERLAGTPEEITYGVLQERLGASRESRICHRELWPLDQQGGPQLSFPLLAQIQPLGTAELRAAALTRWHAVARYLDNDVANLRTGLEQGYTQPRRNVEAVVQELDDLLNTPPETSPLAGLADRDSTPGFRDSVVAIVRDEILPAFTRYRDFLVYQYARKARTATGLAALPDGAECYRALVRANTTVDIDPDTVYQLGVTEMADLQSQMRPIAQRLFGTTDLPALFDRIRTDPAFAFHSRHEIIDAAEAAVARARAAMPEWFGRLPKGDVIVDPCQPFEEQSGCPNSYVPGTADGSRPGRWRINARVEPRQVRLPLEGTAFHETIPGHHLQLTLAAERTDLHPISRYFGFPGFDEGWALYAERLGLEMGIYSSDTTKLGELGEQALRAARLVVDPGLHVRGWSRQQAIEYMKEHTMYDMVTIESEVDRYIANPGQATAYMIGRHEIDRLREEAEHRLGDRFDIREFHDRVLESGGVPLSLLRSHVEAWLAAQ